MPGLARLAAFVAVAAALAGPDVARAATVVAGPEARRDLAVTVYAGDLGLVRDTREVRLGAGAQVVEFRDVASGLDPTSVVLRALPDPGAVAVLDQRYAFDLLSPETLLQRFVGREVQLRQDGRLVTARLLGVAGGPVYEIDGKIHLSPEGTPVLPYAPGDLVARPTLLWRLASREAGAQRLEAAYLTSGLSWGAAYVLILDDAERRADLTAWASVTNRSGTDYLDAALALVAGQIHRAPRAEPPGPRPLARGEIATAAPAPPAVTEAPLSAYHVYALDGPITLPDRETRQIRLLSASGVQVTRRLVYVAEEHVWAQARGGVVPPQPPVPRAVAVELELENSQARGLGRPLPAGVARAYRIDRGGALRLVGEDAIEHTAKDETARLRLGAAFDVVAARRQVEWTRIDDRTFEAEWEIAVRNRSDTRETVRVVERVPGDWRLLRSSLPAEKVDAGTLRWDVPVPAGGEARLVYRVRSRW